MSVVTVAYSMEVPKESKEIVDALAAILAHFKAKKPLAEAAVLLPAVMVAVDGWDKVGEEVKSAHASAAGAYMVHQLWGALSA